MKSNVFTMSLILIVTMLISHSCKKDDTIEIIAHPVVSGSSKLSSDAFNLNAIFSLHTENVKIAYAGIFFSDEPNIDQYSDKLSTDSISITNGATTEHTFKFVNINDDNDRIFEVGTTVYYRPYIVVIAPNDVATYYFGDEKSLKVPKAKYTIMVYGVGGKTLDWSNTALFIIPMMKAGRDGDVEVTFLYKPSLGCQSEIDFPLEGTHRWVLPYEGDFANVWPSSYDELKGNAYVMKAYEAISKYSEKIGESAYRMSNPNHLASFINWSMEKCPAEHYILLFKDHGAGYDLYNDIQSDSELNDNTKTQLSDDNVTRKKTMSLESFVQGIKLSNVGKLEAMVFDECLMSTWEYLAETSIVANCAMASQEISFSLPGDSFLQLFKDGIRNGDSTFDILSKQVDTYVNMHSDSYVDHGAFDLTAISPVFSSMSAVSKFFNEKYTSNVHWRSIIGNGIMSAIWASSNSSESDRELTIELKAKVEQWDTLSDDEKDECISLIDHLNSQGTFIFCYYDLLNQTIKAAESYPTPELIDDYTSDIALLKTLRNNYDAALRAMAHLNCGMKETENTPYEYTSPSILMQTLHEGCYEYINKNDLFGYAFSKYLKREDAIKAYSSLEIDKNISWSTFLENLLVSGTPFFNNDRQYRQEGK